VFGIEFSTESQIKKMENHDGVKEIEEPFSLFDLDVQPRSKSCKCLRIDQITNVAIHVAMEPQLIDPEKDFKSILKELPQSKNKNNTKTYQCPYCNGFYTEKGIYEHIDAKNEWKRKCSSPKRMRKVK
jgi:hypothetical protein